MICLIKSFVSIFSDGFRFIISELNFKDIFNDPVRNTQQDEGFYLFCCSERYEDMNFNFYVIFIVTDIIYMGLWIFLGKLSISIVAVIIELGFICFAFPYTPQPKSIAGKSTNNIIEIFKSTRCLHGMFDESAEFSNLIKYKQLYKIIVCIVVFSIQFSYFVFLTITKLISGRSLFANIMFRAYFMYYIFAFNLIDIIIHFKKRLKLLVEDKAKIAFCALIAIYAFLSISSIFLSYFLIDKMFPNVNNLKYTHNNEKWLKYGPMKFINPEVFCSVKAPKDDTLNVDDFAMLTTLPRLYKVSKNGKCFINPSNIDIFNATMKYIFGPNYEDDGIYILCKKLVNQKILVISSEKIFNQAFEYLSNDKNLTVLEKQFNISGFEKYQINFDSNLVINPSFITSNGQLWGATHYIIGGGYENSFDISLFIETSLREFQPKLISSLLPLYYPMQSYFKDVLSMIEYLNKYLVYSEDHTSNEIKELLQMYSQFNFSKQSLFTIGHSTSGILFKIASFVSNTTGISFESAETSSNLIPTGISSDSKPIKHTNIFSSKFYTIGNDKSCTVNGILPTKYNFPNVYETACQVAVSCSETKKYVPFCMQVLGNDKQSSEKEFNSIFLAFREHYSRTNYSIEIF